MRDLIKRSEVLNTLEQMYKNEKDIMRSVYVRDTIKDKIREIPTAYDIDEVISQLEKQKPKKPKTDDRYIMYICPCCNDFIKVSHNYCPNCGQKIDFGE